jgi:hypothetical protein
MRLSFVFMLLGLVSLVYAGVLHLYISAHAKKDPDNSLAWMAHDKLIVHKVVAVWAGCALIFTALPLIILKM